MNTRGDNLCCVEVYLIISTPTIGGLKENDSSFYAHCMKNDRQHFVSVLSICALRRVQCCYDNAKTM